MQRGKFAGLNLVHIEQTLRGAGIFRSDDVGGFKDVQRTLTQVAQITNGRGDDVEYTGTGRLGGVKHGRDFNGYVGRPV
jgi:hypothetical protein